MRYHVIVHHDQILTYAVEADSRDEARRIFEAGVSTDFEEVEQDCQCWDIEEIREAESHDMAKLLWCDSCECELCRAERAADQAVAETPH